MHLLIEWSAFGSIKAIGAAAVLVLVVCSAAYWPSGQNAAHRSRLRIWMPTIVWFALICVMSSSTFSSEHTYTVLRDLIRWVGIQWSPRLLNMMIRKGAHFSLYAAFFLILTSGPFKGRPVAAILICMLTGSLDEIHQIMLPVRTPSIFDAGIDTAGALFGLFARLFSDNWHDPPWRSNGRDAGQQIPIVRSRTARMIQASRALIEK